MLGVDEDKLENNQSFIESHAQRIEELRRNIAELEEMKATFVDTKKVTERLLEGVEHEVLVPVCGRKIAFFKGMIRSTNSYWLQIDSQHFVNKTFKSTHQSLDRRVQMASKLIADLNESLQQSQTKIQYFQNLNTGNLPHTRDAAAHTYSPTTSLVLDGPSRGPHATSRPTASVRTTPEGFIEIIEHEPPDLDGQSNEPPQAELSREQQASRTGLDVSAETFATSRTSVTLATAATSSAASQVITGNTTEPTVAERLVEETDDRDIVEFSERPKAAQKRQSLFAKAMQAKRPPGS